MKIVQIKTTINDCKQCPNVVAKSEFGQWNITVECGATKRIIRYKMPIIANCLQPTVEIPSWCPLEDYDGKEG